MNTRLKYHPTCASTVYDSIGSLISRLWSSSDWRLNRGYQLKPYWRKSTANVFHLSTGVCQWWCKIRSILELDPLSLDQRSCPILAQRNYTLYQYARWLCKCWARLGWRVEYSSLFKCLLVVNIVMLSAVVVTPSPGSSLCARGLSFSRDHLLLFSPFLSSFRLFRDEKYNTRVCKRDSQTVCEFLCIPMKYNVT